MSSNVNTPKSVYLQITIPGIDNFTPAKLLYLVFNPRARLRSQITILKKIDLYVTLEAIFSICTVFTKIHKNLENFLQESGYFAILNGKLWQILIFLIILRKFASN